MVQIQPRVPEEQYLALSSLSPTAVQKRLALAVVLALALAFVVAAGLHSSIQPPRILAFVPACAAAMFVNSLITATLLLAQFWIVRSRALLVIANGYLFTAAVMIPWTLTFPGIFAPRGLLGAGLQSAAWLYLLWHAGFPLFVIAYALLKDADASEEFWKGPPESAALSSIAVIAGVCLATFLIVAGDTLLPQLMLDTVYLSAHWQYAAPPMALVIVVALIMVWRRRRTLLDLWLMVVLSAYGGEILLIWVLAPARYSVGWYAGRIFELISGSLVLFVLLYETMALYARLLHALLGQRREREARLATGDLVAAMIAHEIKQPLSGMVTNAYAGVRLLDHSEPNLDEAKAAFAEIVVGGHRAGEVIESVRTIFKRDAHSRAPLNISKLIAEALLLLSTDLRKHGVSIQAEPNAQVPAVIGDPILLRQVLVNLMTNAIDSMAITAGPRILSVRSDVRDGGVLVSVADTGMGIKSGDRESIFNPLFTTKSDGMGIGLSICRSVIEAHGGRLWFTPNTPQGAVFQFMLCADTATSATPHDQEAI